MYALAFASLMVVAVGGNFATPCEPRVLQLTPILPKNAASYEKTTELAAKTLSGMAARHLADGGPKGGRGGVALLERTAALVRAALVAAPRAVAAALGAPQLNLGVLGFAQPDRLVIFQTNNSAVLERYWRALAAPWNVTERVWSGAWRDCSHADSWVRGVAIAAGADGARSAAALFVRLEPNRCDPAQYELFDGPPSCDTASTICEPTSAADRGEYQCRCREGYRPTSASIESSASHVPLVARGVDAATVSVGGARGPLRCDACDAGCITCDERGQCVPDALHTALLTAQVGLMGLTMIMGVIIFQRRKSKSVASGMWLMLETILIGIFLLFGTGAISFLDQSEITCLGEVWLRELGFFTCYGACLLKLHRHLIEFRTRKAHRCVMRDSDLLARLATLLCAAVIYLSAFTAHSCEHGGAGACAARLWRRVTEIAELLLLIVGLRIAYAARSSQYRAQERQFLTITLSVEAIASVVSAVLNFAGEKVLPGGGSATMKLVSGAARAYFSGGVPLALAVSPALRECAPNAPHADDGGAEPPAEPSAAEVREELRRVYLQLETLRGRYLCVGNPYVSKRLGGRVTHRRFSLQKKGSREKALQAKRMRDKERSEREDTCDGEASRTPEDSVCSVEGPSVFTDGEPTRSN